MLGSSRFRHFISSKLRVSPSSVHGYIIGEHGDSSVPVWSAVNVGGTRLIDANPKIGRESDSKNWEVIHTNVVESATKIIKKKGYTSWAIGVTISTLVQSILKNTHAVLPCSINLNGLYKFKEDNFMSNPVVIGENGVEQIFKLSLDESEQSQLELSCKTLTSVIKGVKF